jgi:hypothetical protein
MSDTDERGSERRAFRIPSREELARMDWREIQADIPPEDRAWDSDYTVGVDHYPEGTTLNGQDPVELAKKWGGNPGGASPELKRRAAEEL